MKNRILSLLLCVFCVCFAPCFAHAYIDRDVAVVKIMDKAAGKVQTVQLSVGVMECYEKLSLIVRSCKQTDPFQAQDYFAFIEISKTSDGKIFSGWMSRNEPGDNPLQNADYDVWLESCQDLVAELN